MSTTDFGKFGTQHNLIGRKAGKDRLLGHFKAAGRGLGRVVLVPGHSGIGKTSLVQWLEIPVAKENGIFVTGKFNQYHQNSPYYAIRQALASLWGRISSPDMAGHDLVVDEIRQTLGDFSILLSELIPETMDLFDDQSAVDDRNINYIEARHRFTTVIINFLKIAARPEHPVVIFIDDWQWADFASLELLKGLHTSDQVGFCLILASYRDEEVGQGHPLGAAIASLNRHPIPPAVVPVERLDQDAVREMVDAALGDGVENLEEFTDHIEVYTRGNPFHIKAFMGFLYRTGLLWFDQDGQIWRWQMNPDLPEDIVAIFIRLLDRFSRDAKGLISMAACIGNFFDLKTLGMICKRKVGDCLSMLAPLIDEGLALEVEGDRARPSSLGFMFLHDRVQQAAYLLIDPEKRPAIHLEIGRRLLSSLSSQEVSSRLFEILEHLNIGQELITDPMEQKKMIELNMQAAARARSAIAFNAMLTFNRFAYKGVCRLPGGAGKFWLSHYEEALLLHRDLAESEFLEGDKKRAEQLIQSSLPHTKTAIERAESLTILIVQYTLLAKYEQAISSARQALAEFNISLPTDGFESHRDREIAKIKAKLTDTAVTDIRHFPLMTDPVMLTITKLLITLGPPCYRTHQRLWSVIVPKVVNLSLDFGLVPQIGYSHTALGGLLCWTTGDYDRAFDLGRVAETVMTKTFESPADLSVFYLMIGSSIRHWFRPLSRVSQDYDRAFETGRQSGNLQYAAYAFGHNMYCRFFQGAPLNELTVDTEQALGFSRTRLNHWAIDLLEGGLRIFKKLTGPSDPAAVDDRAYLAQVDGNKNIQVRCIYTIFNAFQQMLHNDNERAFSLCREVEPLLYSVGTQGLLPWPEYEWIRFLVMAALYDTRDEAHKTSWLASLRKIREQIDTWARHCPETYSHKSLLAAAELYRIEDRPEKAALFYDRAIAAARANQFLQWGGIANERAFAFWAYRGNGYLAHSYWQQAYTCYGLWGSSAKLSQMEDRFRKKIEFWYAQGIPVSRIGTPAWEKDARTFSDKHIELIRADSRVNQQLKKRESASRLSRELSEAVEHLRIESAERRQAEAELTKTMLENKRYIRQLEQKNKELDEFTYIASHDLQEPLRKLTAFSKLLVRDLDVELNDNAQKDIHFIMDAAQRMETLIRDLLELSRTGRGGARLEPVSMTQCLDEVESLLKAKLDERGAVLIRAELPEVRGDRTLLSLVFQNLIQNALKFNDKEYPKIEVTCAQRNGATVFGVKDNGIGIAPEYTRQIFQPFKRLHGRNDYPGSGIGLAIVKKIIDHHNGSVWVDSIQGDFTHFQFTLNPSEDKHAKS